jgi:hypothetical protein
MPIPKHGGGGYKTSLVIVQVLGYTLSKFLGIKVIAEMSPHRRAAGILVLIGAAQAALVLFGLIPPPWNIACLFVNGLALGMVFGLVLGFLEGRRQTEALAAGLCASFILADGAAKSVGAYLLAAGVAERWMPAAAGFLFVLPLFGFVWMLTRIPPPSSADAASRGERRPMTTADRRAFFRRYASGLTLLVLVYLLTTILRSIRADFAPEIWQGLGWTGQPEVFTRSEVVVMFGVTASSGLTVLIADNRKAFHAAMATSLGGLALIGAAVGGLAAGWLGGFGFMVLVGLGLYLPYVAVHTTLFERLIAMTRDRGNIGYLMYLADAFGYLGYAAVMLAQNGARGESGFVSFFLAACVITAVVGGILMFLCWAYFAAWRPRPLVKEQPQ